MVTGAAGFIGSQVCSKLLDHEHQVIGLDNLNDYYDVRLKEWRLLQLQNHSCAQKFYFEKLDIENQDRLKNFFKEYGSFDAVINLAARAGVRYSLENPHIYLATNLTGTLNLLESMREFGCKKFVLASTSSLYAGQKMPFTEDLAVNEPLSPYAASKKGAELMAYSYHKLFEIDVSVVRYFTVFGPAGRPDMSPYRLIKWISEGETIQLFGDGSQSRDFTYVDDIASGTIAAIKNVGYEIINLGGGRNPVSLSNLIEKLEIMLGKKAAIDYQPFHVADLMETWANIGKAKKLFCWKPQVSLEEGLSKSVDWYMQNRKWLNSVKV